MMETTEVLSESFECIPGVHDLDISFGCLTEVILFQSKQDQYLGNVFTFTWKRTIICRLKHTAKLDWENCEFFDSCYYSGM